LRIVGRRQTDCLPAAQCRFLLPAFGKQSPGHVLKFQRFLETIRRHARGQLRFTGSLPGGLVVVGG
jgi:hypothetical protein